MPRVAETSTRDALLDWNPREPNVYTPKGVMRPRPIFVSGGPLSPRQTWSYRGWRIDIRELASDHFDAKISTGSAINSFTITPSPGEAEALQAAVFHIDRSEALKILSNRSLAAANRVRAAEDAIRRALDVVRSSGGPLTRANVAREVQLLETGPQLVAEWAKAFRELPVDERLELIDELIAIAATHGGRPPFLV